MNHEPQHGPDLAKLHSPEEILVAVWDYCGAGTVPPKRPLRHDLPPLEVE